MPEVTHKELEKQRIENLRKSLWVSSMDNTFKNFKHEKGTEAAFENALKFAEGKADYSLLLIYGGVGNGKSYLCDATAIKLNERGLFCRVLSWPDIVRTLRIAIDGKGLRSPDEIVDGYCKVKRLIIDDIGAGQSGTDYAFNELEEIIDYRYHERLFTFMTTNKDLKELPERVLSRLKDREISCLVLNEGADYRRKK